MDYYQGFYGWFLMPAPEVWTVVFNEIKKDLKSYHIYPTSVLMLMFHEKENYAKHFYSTGSGKNVSHSKWYIFYENLFVEQNGIFLKWEKDESWVFFYDDNKYYIVKKDEKEGFQLTGEEGFYQKTDPINELYFLTLKNKNGEKTKHAEAKTGGRGMKILCVEDGSIDERRLEVVPLQDGEILVYRQGAKPPFVLEIPDNKYDESKIRADERIKVCEEFRKGFREIYEKGKDLTISQADFSICMLIAEIEGETK